MLGGDILHDIPKHVLITSTALTKGGAIPAEVLRRHLQLKCSDQDGRACVQILQFSLQEARQRRKTWGSLQGGGELHRISEADERPDIGSRVR